MMKNKFLFLIAILIPVTFVFRNFFISGPLAAGDAPFFYPQGLQELISEPLAWTNRGFAFGGVNQLLWLSPIMLLYGFIGSFLGNDLTIRILFYIPSVVAACVGINLLVKHFGGSTRSSLLATLLYIFNSYFLLLVDGGQVGVILAYGLFPCSLYTLIKLYEDPNLYTWIKAFLLHLLLFMIDPRIAIIEVLTSIIWLKRKSLKLFIILCIALVTSQMYWLLPLFKNTSGAITTLPLQAPPITLLNSLTLFQPHWPSNIYGVITHPYFYFILFPIILLLGTYRQNNRRFWTFFAMYLVFAFIAKGDADPFGEYYTTLVNLPFGFAFRDSTKFFIPLILFASLLFSQFQGKLKTILLYLFIILTIFPAFIGQLKLVLSTEQFSNEYLKISQELQTVPVKFRTAWFPEVHPLALDLRDKSAISAKQLVDYPLFAQPNTGSSDRFNFMNNDQNYLPWFRLLGIRYLVFSGDHRNTKTTDEGESEWSNLLANVDKSPQLINKDWASTIPVYEVQDIKPRIMGSDKLIVTTGGIDIANPNIPMSFLEDGSFNWNGLVHAVPSSLYFYLEDKQSLDVQMSMLQSYFYSTNKARVNNWSNWQASDYLKYKYELLIRGVALDELDYRQGLSFSTKANEEIIYTLNQPQGEYMLAIRSFSIPGSGSLQIQTGDTKLNVDQHPTFRWDVQRVQTDRKKIDINIKHDGGLWVVNTVAFVPIAEWSKTEKLTAQYLEKNPVLDDSQFQELVSQNHWKDIQFEEVGANRVRVVPQQGISWVFTNDLYHPLWKLQRGIDLFDSVSLYGLTSGFYLSSSWGKSEIVFMGQENFRWGVYFSAISLLTIISGILYVYAKK